MSGLGRKCDVGSGCVGWADIAGSSGRSLLVKCWTVVWKAGEVATGRTSVDQGGLT